MGESMASQPCRASFASQTQPSTGAVPKPPDISPCWSWQNYVGTTTEKMQLLVLPVCSVAPSKGFAQAVMGDYNK